MREKLYVVHGAGPDAVGLVQQIAAPIAHANGNVVDLRQDVLHGLFTVVMVVDLAETTLRAEQFRELIGAVAEDTGLALAVDKYNPVPRSPGRKSLLIVLVGRDRPGIIARISNQLSGYNVNIELSRMIARAGIFLMELHADVTECALPLGNLLAALREEMGAVGISTMFQAEDVFNKRKRVVCFDIAGSFIDPATLHEVVRQAGIDPASLGRLYDRSRPRDSARAAARLLEGLAAEVVTRVAEAIEVTPATTELVETLKMMGYKVIAITSAFDFFTDVLARKAALDACYGFRLPVNDDTRALTGEPDPAADPTDRKRLLATLVAAEGISEQEVTVLSDADAEDKQTPGLRVELHMKVMLDYLNQRILSRDQVTGLLGSFGVPRG
jgi:predicted amino acid-binding ACT domain protein